jgi:hypothetical protein
MKTPLLFALVLVLASAAACSSKTTTASTTTATPADVISAECSFMQRCDPVEYHRLFASNSDCVATFTRYVGPEMQLPGVTQDELNTVVNLANTEACGSHPVVFSTGSLANGAGCANNIQCQSGVCSGTDSACGVCVGAAAGAACSITTPCAAPNACISGTCQAKLADGASCTDSTQCQNGACDSISADAFAGQVCKTETGIAEGQSCAGGGVCAPTLFCNGATCVQPVYVALGQPCTTSTPCEGSYCDPTTSVCTAFIAAGSACDLSSNTNTCRLECIAVGDGGTTGVCDQVTYPTCN